MLIRIHRMGLIAAVAACLVASPLAAQEKKEVQETKKVQDDSQDEKIAKLMSVARRDLSRENWEGAAENFAKVVKLDPKNGLAWQLHGYALHADGELDSAIKSHKKAVEFGEDRVRSIALYNLGCAYSLKKDQKKAMDYLDKAIDSGFVDENYFETDTDLDNLRDEERFKKMLKVVANGGRDPEDKKDKKDKEDKKDKKDSKFDAKKLVGKWKVTKGMRAGEKVDGGNLPPQIKITEKTITIPSPEGEAFVMGYKIDASKKPVAIDIKIESGPVPEGSALGIIKMNEKTLTLCYDPTGQKRPAEFKTSEDNGCFMFVLKRPESKEKAKDK